MWLSLCDSGNNKQVIAIYQICDGVITGAPDLYDPSTGAAYTLVGTLGKCSDSIDYEVLCDKGTDPNTRILAVWNTSQVPPKLDYFTPATDGSLAVYVPVGPVGACPETDVEESQVCYITTAAGTGYVSGDQMIQIMFWDTGETPPTLVAVVWRNQTQNTVVAAPPPIADLTSCGSKDYEFEILCDKDVITGTSVKFLRRYAVDPTGTTSFIDTDMTGVVA